MIIKIIIIMIIIKVLMVVIIFKIITATSTIIIIIKTAIMIITDHYLKSTRSRYRYCLPHCSFFEKNAF